jgi:copper transport protein
VTLRRRRARRAVVVSALVAVLVVLWAGPAFAHATLEETSPSAGAVLGTSPKSIALRFSESVSVSTGGVRLYDGTGRRIVTGPPEMPADDTVNVPLKGALSSASYVVTWRVVSADTHPVQGSFTFQVGSASNATSRAVQNLATKLLAREGGDRLVAVAWGVTRWLVYASIAMFVGGLVFCLLVWPGALAQRRARRLVTCGWIGATLGTVLGLLLQGPYVAGLGIGQAFDVDLLEDVLDTRFGHVWLARLGVLVVAFGLMRVLFRWQASPSRSIPQWWTAGATLVGVAIVASPALSGHASAGDVVPLTLLSDSLHVAAMSVWLGGLVLLIAVALRGHDLPRMQGIAMRFSRVATVCVVTIIVTGAFQTWRLVGSLDAMRTTDFGRILIVKLVLFALMVVVATFSREIVHRLAGAPRRHARRVPVVAGGADDDPTRTSGAEDPTIELRALRRSVWGEVAFGVAILAATALLVNAAPAGGAGGLPSGGAVTVAMRTGPVRVDVTVAPAQRGRNDIHVSTLTPAGAPKDVMELTMTFGLPDRRIEALDVPLRRLGPGHYLSPGFEIPIAGDWRVTAKALLSDVDQVTLTDEVTIR